MTNNWSIGGRTCHIETHQQHPCNLKEEDYLVMKEIIGEANGTDIFTNNSAGPVFTRHIGMYCKYQQGIE